jgi:hypothetical protein
MTNNHRDNRGAGTGVILAGSNPFARGIWDVYETTNPLIGLFERSFWLEGNPNSWPPNVSSRKILDEALDDFSIWVDTNLVDNLIFLEWTNIRIMGGIANIHGKQIAGSAYRREKERKTKGIVDAYDDHPSTVGYELRLSERDAVTFVTLWGGYEPTPSNV